MEQYDVIVIGAGAAGLLAAGRAAELGAKVLLMERNKSAGRKLLITGKGHCNITNDAPPDEFLRKVFPNGRFLRHAFSVFFSDGLISLLEREGVETFIDRGNRVFPVSRKSSDVVNALTGWLASQHVEIRYMHRVESLLFDDYGVCGVSLSQGTRRLKIHGHKIIVATGGKSYPATGSTGDGYKLAETAGHSIAPLHQALVPLETVGDIAQKMQGLSLKNVRASVWIDGKKVGSEFGEMLFTHFGLSGPIILTLSRRVVEALNARRQIEISIDLKPALDEGTLNKRLLRDIDKQGSKKIVHLLALWMPALMIPVFIQLAGLDPEMLGNQLTAPIRKKILLLLKDLRFKVNGCRSFKEAIITAGGINTSEVNPTTLESKICKNLYFAGEVLNLDADTGGYNLQIAWSTGWLAGESAAMSKLKV